MIFWLLFIFLTKAKVDARKHVAMRSNSPLEDLNAESLERASNFIGGQDRKLIVSTFADWRDDTTFHRQQKEMAESWATHLKHLNVNCLIGICTDSDLLRHDVNNLLVLESCEVRRVKIAQCVQNPRLGRWWGVEHILEAGYDVLNSDSDIAFLRSPNIYLSALLHKHPQMDMGSMSDSNTGLYTKDSLLFTGDVSSKLNKSKWERAFRSSRPHEGYVAKQEHAYADIVASPLLEALKAAAGYEIGLESPKNCDPHQLNTGLMLWRATPRSLSVLKEWRRALEPMLASEKADDQLPFNKIAKHKATHCSRNAQPSSALCGDDHLNAIWDGRACFGLFNLIQFSNGFTFQVARLHEQYHIRPILYHATYTANKKLSLQEEGAFNNKLSHDKMLSYTAKLPELPSVFTPETHYYYVQTQLLQFRAALKIAQMLNRTIILPFVAGLQECFFYAPEANGIISGHRVNLPTVYTTSSWLKIDKFAHPYREPGFTPGLFATHKSTKASKALSSDFEHVQMLHLTSTDTLQTDDKLDKDIEDALGSWCCKNEGAHPNVRVFKLRYKLFAPPRFTPENEPGHGNCVI